MNYIKALIVSILIATNIYATTSSIEEINIPQEHMNYEKNLISAEQSFKGDEWQKFMNEYGEWAVSIDKYSGTPVNAIGKAIKIVNSDELTPQLLQNASMSFLRKNQNAFNINPDDLKFVKAHRAKDVWYVSYVQTHKDIEIMLSEIELRIFKNGNLMAFRIKSYQDVDIDETPSLSMNEAINISFNNAKNGVSLLSKDDRLYVLPVFNGIGFDYKLVYNYDIRDNSTAETFKSFIDANSGEVVWRYKTSFDVASKITTSGSIKMTSPNSEPSDEIFQYQKVLVNGNEYFTDENGELDVELSAGDIIESNFEGKYGRIIYQNTVPTAFTDTVDIDGNYDLYWNEQNSSVYDRFGYYHVNNIRNWITDIDSELTAMDIIIDVVFMDTFMGYEMVNAFSTTNGDSIAFVGFKDSESRLSESPSVLYHEYGHGINTRLYKAMGKQSGMTNRSLHEALADVTSAMVIDDPRVGANVFVSDPEKVIRNIENDNVYPDDIIAGNQHHNGLILAGAIWDVRKSVSLDFAKSISHFARYGTPDDADIGMAYAKYFVEFLIAADDDGDLSNGTPYFTEIVSAFNRHQIGTNLLLTNSIFHQPLANTPEFDNPFEVDFRFETQGILGTEVDSAFVIYTTDNFESIERVKVPNVASNEFAGHIPALDKPSFVNYKIEFYTPFSAEANYYPLSEDNYYTFLAGFATLYKDNFENPEDWTIGYDSDNAQGGRFEIAPPQLFGLNTSAGIMVIQPGENHSEEGENCLVTGATVNSSGNPFGNSLLSGTTSAITPTYDLSNTSEALLTFYLWNMRLKFSSNETDNPFLTIYASNDDGWNWNEIHSFNSTQTGEWFQQYIVIPKEFLSNQTKFRFSASSPLSNQILVEVLIDDLEIVTPAPLSSIPNIDEDAIAVYPNPFADRITIESYGYEASIYDLTGLKIYDIPKGISNWNGQNMNGTEVESGVYIIRINDGNSVLTKKIIKL